MHHARLAALVLYLTLALPAFAAPSPAPAAAEARPLAVGTKAPGAAIQDATGQDLDLTAALAGKPTLLVFYRGGWCPYCNRHLAALTEIEGQLRDLGWQILALSPDRPAALAPTAEKNHLGYRLLSDRAMHAAAAYGLAFRVDPATRERYAGYNVDLAPVPGEADPERWLPVPAAFLVDRAGVIRFVHASPDYRVRIPTDELLSAARAAAP